MKHKSKYWDEETNKYICECGKYFEKSQSLNAHFGHCLIHKTKLGKPITKINWWLTKGKMNGWDKFTKEEIQNFHIVAGKSLSKNIKNGIIIPSFKGRHHKEKSKEKLRHTILKNIETQYGGVKCNYSKRACEYINNLNIKNNWKLQHALNGGEVRIGNYWVDGYDKENKIIFEYDEPKHYISKISNILRDKDKIRQQKIIDIVGKDWKFYRYNENLNILYKVV